jgi:hypothetical protein
VGFLAAQNFGYSVLLHGQFLRGANILLNKIQKKGMPQIPVNMGAIILSS